MRIEENYSLQGHNTFGVDVKTRWFMEYNSVEELQELMQRDEVKRGPLLAIGGGSNLLFLEDFPGVVLHSAIGGIVEVKRRFGHVYLEVGSGVVWDDVCAFAAERGLGGIENLSGIPGEMGAAAVQNIGAYGVEIKDVVERVTAYGIADGKMHLFKCDDCNYGYRDSYFKGMGRGQYIVCSVLLRLDVEPEYDLSYGSLSEALEKVGEVSVGLVRDSVMAIRDGKLPDPNVLGNAGSFFKNPVITNEQYYGLLDVYRDMPSYMLSDDMVKVPAAWLIERCGWKGKRVGDVGVYAKQSLVLVNYGGGTASAIGNLASEIIESVKEKFGITLVPEVNFIGSLNETK